MTSFEIKNAISKIKKEKNAVIAAHNYQVDEIQEIADIVGDSFALSRFCAEAAYDVIVFCGVHFMAESAKILSPHKTVLLPESDAGCPMADMVDPERLKKAKLEHPGAAVVCYINSSAAVKAESDVCCTSSNAVRIVSSMKEKDIIFVPDCNLAGFVAKQVPDKNIIPWKGFCITHHRVRKEDVLKAKEVHPDAVLLVHPECRPEVAAMADFVGSTSQIIDYAAKSSKSKFIIGTEMGVMYKLKNDNPGKQFFLLSQGLICPNMKKNTLKSVYNSLNEMKYVIEVDEEIRLKAVKALQRMLEMA